MKLKDIARVYSGGCVITIYAYFKDNGEYYSFRSYGDGAVTLNQVDEHTLNLEVRCISCARGCMYIDLKELIDRRG